MFLEGHIIEFLDDDRLKVGFVRRQEHDRLQVVDPRGRHISVSADRVVVVHSRSSEDSFHGYARELSEKVQLRQTEMDVELLWESLNGNLREFTTAELATIFFSESSPETASAVFRTLSDDTLFFRRKGTQFLPKTSNQVETERTRRGRELENAHAREQLVETLHRLMRGKTLETASEVAPILDRIHNWLRLKDGDPVGAILEELTSATQARDAAFDILARAGRIDSRRDRFLVLAGIEEEFPDVVKAAAESLVPYSHVSGRVDYRDARAFTIDDDDTLEVDDAITFRKDGARIVVGIHIADVSSFVKKGDLLDIEASARYSTIYLPSYSVRMFPERLSTDLASLRCDVDRPAFTVEVEFDEQFNLTAHRLALSTIHVKERLSYQEADRQICDPQRDPALRTLHAIALRLQQERAEHGAVTLRRPEIQVHVDDSGIHVGKLDANSPSRLLVTEMMILCNRLSADFASANALPVIYRTQEPRDASVVLPTGDLDPLSFEKLRKSFKRSRLSLTPGPHSGLGVSAYTQASSPIRRFTDLVTQRQFAAFLKSEPAPYSRDEITGFLSGAETAEQEIRGIEDRSTNYWLLEFLSREKMGHPMNAFVLDRKGNIELEDFYVRGKLQSPGGEDPGTMLSVLIDTIQPAKGDVRFKRA